MQNQKGFANVILAVVVTAILIGGIVFVWQNTTQPALAPSNQNTLPEAIDESVINLPAEEFEDTEKVEANAEAEDQTADWLTYTNTEVGFSFKYPQKMSAANVGRPPFQKLSYSVEVQAIDDLLEVAPLSMDKASALKNQEFLAQGNVEAVHYDWSPIVGSVKLIDLESVNARSFTILGRFEVGDITFERALLFYVGDYQVVLTVYGPNDAIVSSISDYFTLYGDTDTNQIEAWEEGAMTDFWDDLINNNSSQIAQEWFDTFDKIVSTIEIN